MKEVVIASYLRTAFSRAKPNDPAKDWLHKFRADELLALLMPEVIKKAGVDPKDVEDFIIGCSKGVNEQWTIGGRTPIFLANLPGSIAAKFVDQEGGSSMAAIHVGFMEVALGIADVVLVGGMESMTRIPMGMAAMEKGFIAPPMNLVTDPKYKHWDIMTSLTMGLLAEKLYGTAGITREEMDKWGVSSQNLATNAQDEGFFKDEILPIEAEQADGSFMTVEQDQCIRPDVNLEGLAKLKPIFNPENGGITAGTSSPMNDGASSLVLMSKETAHKRGIKPLATIRSIGFAGVDPVDTGEGPLPASKKALEQAGLTSADIDFWEINEDFCIFVLHCMKKLGIDPEKVNVMGGCTAIGHPLGATGARLVGTLARILDKKQARIGCATMCCGLGQGVSTIIEREEYNW